MRPLVVPLGLKVFKFQWQCHNSFSKYLFSCLLTALSWWSISIEYVTDIHARIRWKLTEPPPSKRGGEKKKKKEEEEAESKAVKTWTNKVYVYVLCWWPYFVLWGFCKYSLVLKKCMDIFCGLSGLLTAEGVLLMWLVASVAPISPYKWPRQVPVCPWSFKELTKHCYPVLVKKIQCRLASWKSKLNLECGSDVNFNSGFQLIYCAWPNFQKHWQSQ